MIQNEQLLVSIHEEAKRVSQELRHTHRGLEKLVAGENPDGELTESTRYISANQIEVKISMTQNEFEDFKRAQNLLCQKRKKQVSLKVTLHHATLEFLKREDPVVRAAPNSCSDTPSNSNQRSGALPKFFAHW